MVTEYPFSIETFLGRGQHQKYMAKTDGNLVFKRSLFLVQIRKIWFRLEAGVLMTTGWP
jgi:hypothetical protein